MHAHKSHHEKYMHHTISSQIDTDSTIWKHLKKENKLYDAFTSQLFYRHN